MASEGDGGRIGLHPPRRAAGCRCAHHVRLECLLLRAEGIDEVQSHLPVVAVVVPFGSAQELRSRTTYRPATPKESAPVDACTGTCECRFGPWSPRCSRSGERSRRVVFGPAGRLATWQPVDASQGRAGPPLRQTFCPPSRTPTMGRFAACHLGAVRMQRGAGNRSCARKSARRRRRDERRRSACSTVSTRSRAELHRWRAAARDRRLVPCPSWDRQPALHLCAVPGGGQGLGPGAPRGRRTVHVPHTRAPTIRFGAGGPRPLLTPDPRRGTRRPLLGCHARRGARPWSWCVCPPDPAARRPTQDVRGC